MHPKKEPSDGIGETSQHVRRAREGNRESLAWIVHRFSPLLLAQARYRLGDLRSIYDAEDVVAEVWAIALTRISTLSSDRLRKTPALLRFLGTIVVFRTNNLVRSHLRRKLLNEGAAQDSEDNALSKFPAETSGVLTRAVRDERKGILLASIDALDPVDREIVILRGVEQHENQEVADMLDMKPNTISHRYRRALDKLRERLPGSVFDELGTD